MSEKKVYLVVLLEAPERDKNKTLVGVAYHQSLHYTEKGAEKVATEMMIHILERFTPCDQISSIYSSLKEKDYVLASRLFNRLSDNYRIDIVPMPLQE